MTKKSKKSIKNAIATRACSNGPRFSPLRPGTARTILDFKYGDGSDRVPRAVQTEFLDWLRDGFADHAVHCGQLPTGIGKSYLARAIQIVTGADVITPSNILIDQYIGQYPHQNYLKGKSNYRCFSGMACSDWIDIMQQPACGECPYVKSRERAKVEATFYNPMSLYYFRILNRHKQPVMIVDEAHQLPSMAMKMCERKLRKSLYQWDDRCRSEVYLVPWMKTAIAKLTKLFSIYDAAKQVQKAQEIANEIAGLGLIVQEMETDPQNFAVYTEKSYYHRRPESFLVIRPIRPPRSIMQRLLDCDKLILLSGTLFPVDIADLIGSTTPYRFIDLPSPIPVENRLIHYRPVSFAMNYQTDPAMIAAAIEAELDRHSRQNTIIHVTYELSRKIAKFFTRPILTNMPQSKMAVLETFKRDGGIWLASGCAEGLDLKDDLCTLNIIPKLMYPDQKDLVVQKRRAQSDGNQWYDIMTLRMLIQQAGRSSRHEKDKSTTVIMDPNFPRLFSRNSEHLPKSFKQAIVWTS